MVLTTCLPSSMRAFSPAVRALVDRELRVSAMLFFRFGSKPSPSDCSALPLACRPRTHSSKDFHDLSVTRTSCKARKVSSQGIYSCR